MPKQNAQDSLALKDTAARHAALTGQATKHFAYFVSTAVERNHDIDKATRDAKVGSALVAFVLSMTPGEMLNISDWLMRGYSEGDLPHVFSVLPFLCGSLGLLKLVLVHAELGELPHDEVIALLEADEPRTFQGIQLTRDTVVMRYQRLPVTHEEALLQ
jgi:hypothetical protein